MIVGVGRGAERDSCVVLVVDDSDEVEDEARFGYEQS